MPNDWKENVEVNLINLGHQEDDIDDVKGFDLVGGLSNEIKQVREIVELPFTFPHIFKK